MKYTAGMHSHVVKSATAAALTILLRCIVPDMSHVWTAFRPGWLMEALTESKLALSDMMLGLLKWLLASLVGTIGASLMVCYCCCYCFGFGRRVTRRLNTTTTTTTTNINIQNMYNVFCSPSMKVPLAAAISGGHEGVVVTSERILLPVSSTTVPETTRTMIPEGEYESRDVW
jgi:hypothetical protein